MGCRREAALPAAVQREHPGGILTRKPLRREDGDTARLLHRLTSYEPEREWTTPVDDPHVLQDFTPNDLEMLPAQWKSYPPGLPALDLPHDWPSVEVPATEVLAGPGTRRRAGTSTWLNW